jgi:hypothetical protein
MKKLLPLFAITILFFSCQKENHTKNQPDPNLAVQKDTAAVVINGLTYTFNSKDALGLANRAANIRLDSVSKTGQLHLSNDLDSVMFSKYFTLSDESGSGFIAFYFFKKFAKKDMGPVSATSTLGLLVPKDPLQFFAPENYKVPVDFNKWNAHNGIAVEVANKSFYLRSYDATAIGIPDVVSTKAQDDAQFKITSVKQDKWGYVIEGNFTVSLFNLAGQLARTENGYFKFHVR